MAADQASATAVARAALEASDLGALLCFDMNNIRYITATHIGTWAIDKLVRFCLLARGEGTQIPALAGLGIFLARVQPILSRLKFANHDSLRIAPLLCFFASFFQ